MTFVFGSVFAAAQNPACAPNTANYPCVYVANASSSATTGTVSVINATTNKVIGAVAVGNSPYGLTGLAITPDNASVYAAVQFLSTVAVIDTATGVMSATVTGLTGTSPTQVAITPDGKFAYVVEVSGAVPVIDRIDTTKNTVVDSVAGITRPSAIVIAPSGTLAYVADVCNAGACVDIVDTTTTPPAVTSSILIPNFTATGSIAITPDGSVVCLTVENPNLEVEAACINTTTQNSVTVLDLGPALGLTAYGLEITPNDIMYAAEPGSPTAALKTVASINPSTAPPTLLNTIQVGAGPTGVAVGPGGGSLYVTDASDSTVAIIDAATNGVVILGSGNGFSNPQGVAAMTAIPPVIATQPASQAIFAGQTATMSVVATSTAPLSYQWYQVQSSDTSAPIAGATGNSFTTPALASTTSYWVQIINVAGSVNSNIATITVTTVNPPVIATQPASQLILTGQTATLSVVATSTQPLSYQWYQGLSGDTSTPIAGASASSFTTPALTSTTSYWVQVANIAGAVNSNTATVTVTTNRPPTCTLSVVGAGSQSFTNPLSVIATATCADPQGEALNTTITFGDGASSSGANTGVFTATHTYTAYTQQITYSIQVTATDSFGLQSAPAFYSWNLIPTALAPPVFGGQSSTVTVMLASPSGQPEQVQFECTTVTAETGSSPTFTPAANLGISCSSNPATVTLTAVSQPVKIVIQTTGAATAQLRGMKQGMWSFALWAPLPILVFVGVGFSSIRFRRGRFSWCLAVSGLVVLAFLSVSCGGGFTAPNVIHATPPGDYQVTVIDLPVGSTTNSGFVQTSLIVPLTVSPFQ